jgi:hypothetical protein
LENSNFFKIFCQKTKIHIQLSKDKVYQGTSLSEDQANKLVQKEPLSAIMLSNKIIIKTYPSGTRTGSSNYDPVNFWNCGLQMSKLKKLRHRYK